ncbi:hypothetical protein V492_06654 [Pseudogymnoascus sp. VKM F-4246]|nr:hypothetical protein V492_06654 [Pseudogymnoascus sp. VKM F-4246]
MSLVSVLGAGGSLGSLISATGILSKELYKLARGVRAAKKDIRKFARKLAMFSWSSNEACACLLRHYSNESGLDTLANAKKKRFLKRAEESAEEILKDVEKISPRLLSMEPAGIELTLISKIRWHKRKSAVRDLNFEMGALQTSLTLLVSTVTYEVQIRDNADPEVLAMTMAQITNLIEGAEVMASKFEKLANTQHAADRALQSLNVLVNNMVKVADKQLDEADAAREATGEYEPGSWVKKKDASTFYFVNPSRSRPEIQIQKEARHGSLQPPLPPNKRKSVRLPTDNQRKEKERQADRELPEASSSRGLQDPLEANRLDSHDAGIRSKIRLSKEASMWQFNTPSASDEYEEINGIITEGMARDSKALSRTITARLYPKFSMNTISRAYVEKLGLGINTHSINFATSDEAPANHTVGEVRFAWHTASHITHVTCTVFEHEIIKGVPFTLGEAYKRQVRRSSRVVDGESSRAVGSS